MIEVTLTVENQGGIVEAHLTFTNQGEKELDLVKFIVLSDGQASNNFFTIKSGGKSLEYRGEMKKRAHPGPNGFYWLSPGQSVSGRLRLNDFYPIPKTGILQIYYECGNHFAKHDQRLRSNVVEVTLAG